MQRPWGGHVLGPQRHLEEASVAGAAWEGERKKQIRLISVPHREASQYVLGAQEGSEHHVTKVQKKRSPRDPGRCWLHSSPSRTC